ncbi:MAG TPA: hypothetical protein VHT04_03400 [Stellaceae bacterium]|jgi:hypothetical protein|nr:hypothetical protein [Stellaceae bacterium]
MTRLANRFPLPMSVLAIIVAATLFGCAAGVAFGIMLSETVSMSLGAASKATV